MFLPTTHKAIHYFLPCLLYCTLFTNALSCFSQITFNKTYDFEGSYETGSSVIYSYDENYIVTSAGWTKRFGNYDGIQIFKVDTLGNLMWTKAYGDSGYMYKTGFAFSGALTYTHDSNYVMCGQYVNLDFENGGDVLLMKFDDNGDTLWMKTYGEATKTEWSSQVIQTKDNGFAIIGTTSAGNGDYYLIKTDSMGNKQWQRTYGGGGRRWCVIYCYNARWWLYTGGWG